MCVRWDHDLDPRKTNELYLWMLRVIVAAPDPTADRCSNDHAGSELAPRAVTVLRQFVHNLLICRPNEISELNFRNRHHAIHRHPHRGPNDAVFGQWTINDSLRSKLIIEARGDAKYAAHFSDIFSEEDNATIRTHRNAKSVVDR